MGAWARAGWRVWDLGNGTIMLQKLFNPEWQVTSKSFPSRLFLSLFIFTNRGNFQVRTWVWRKFAAENRVKEGIGQESNGAANQEKQIFLLWQISPSTSSTRDLGTGLAAPLLVSFLDRRDVLSMRRVFGSYFERISLVRFDRKSINRRLLVLDHDLPRRSTVVKWVRMLKPRACDRARVGMGCTISIKKKASDKMVTDLNFAVFVFISQG